MTIQHAFDLGGFNPIAENLDLFIDAPEVSNLAVIEISRQVARAIQPRARLKTEPVSKKFFRGESMAIKITARHAHAANAEFAFRARRKSPKIRATNENR